MASREYEDFVRDLFAEVPGTRQRRMFGGLGVFRDDLMFALVADDVLYFKADATTIPAFEAEGSGPFVYEGKKGAVTMSFWRAPERLFDEAEEFRAWADRAFEVALRAAAGKAPKRGKD